jgi:hypothetical protein
MHLLLCSPGRLHCCTTLDKKKLDSHIIFVPCYDISVRFCRTTMYVCPPARFQVASFGLRLSLRRVVDDDGP